METNKDIITIELYTTIKNFQNQPIMDEKNKSVILKDMLLDYLGFFQSDDGKELIAAAVLAHRIYAGGEGKFDLEPKEVAIIKKAVQTPRHIAMAYASMMDRLKF